MDIWIPKEWLPKVTMKRVHIHWTAGPAMSRPDEAEHYHMILNQDLTLRKGVDIRLNSYAKAPAPKGYAAHTWNANQYAIGYSLAGMRLAKQSPFDPGPDPITEPQYTRAVRHTAQLCKFYGIPVSRKTVLTHAEVQANLGITQKAKWDIAILPWQPKEFNTAEKVGNLFRSEVQYLLEKGDVP